jgi:hypothetical protein
MKLGKRNSFNIKEKSFKILICFASFHFTIFTLMLIISMLMFTKLFRFAFYQDPSFIFYYSYFILLYNIQIQNATLLLSPQPTDYLSFTN